MTGMTEESQPAHPAWLLPARAGIGLVQGVALYLLSEHSKQGQGLSPSAFEALMMAAVFLPVLALGSIGALRPRTAWIWLAAAGLVVLGLGAYDGLAQAPRGGLGPSSPIVMAMAGAGLFITHYLILPADQEGRWVATYERYFDDAWKDGVRIALAVLFVGASWLLLLLGASLFGLIGLKFLRQLIEEPWFAFPFSTLAFALAVHMTDMQASLVRGIRAVALTLLSVLLPLMALIAVGFLAALPFTGLHPLWATKSAAAILLAACAALIILINAAYQAGERDGFPPLALKWAARATALVIAPLVAIAAYGVWLRTGQYGLTPDRIYATACLLVAACYGIGYAVAAVRPGPWLKTLEITNIAAACLAVAVLTALLSPAADPQRLSVASQVARLNAGKIRPDKFDYNFLHYQAGKAGQAALADLANRKAGPHAADIAERARLAQTAPVSYGVAVMTRAERAGLVRVAGGGSLPDSFLAQKWAADPLQPCDSAKPACSAIVADLNKDGEADIVLLTPYSHKVYSQVGGPWVEVGALSEIYCPAETDAVAAGRFKVVPPAPVWQDIEIDGQRRQVDVSTPCPP